VTQPWTKWRFGRGSLESGLEQGRLQCGSLRAASNEANLEETATEKQLEAALGMKPPSNGRPCRGHPGYRFGLASLERGSLEEGSLKEAEAAQDKAATETGSLEMWHPQTCLTEGTPKGCPE
jgi:hypothetical protein